MNFGKLRALAKELGLNDWDLLTGVRWAEIWEFLALLRHGKWHEAWRVLAIEAFGLAVERAVVAHADEVEQDTLVGAVLRLLIVVEFYTNDVLEVVLGEGLEQLAKRTAKRLGSRFSDLIGELAEEFVLTFFRTAHALRQRDGGLKKEKIDEYRTRLLADTADVFNRFKTALTGAAVGFTSTSTGATSATGSSMLRIFTRRVIPVPVPLTPAEQIVMRIIMIIYRDVRNELDVDELRIVNPNFLDYALENGLLLSCPDSRTRLPTTLGPSELADVEDWRERLRPLSMVSRKTVRDAAEEVGYRKLVAEVENFRAKHFADWEAKFIEEARERVAPVVYWAMTLYSAWNQHHTPNERSQTQRRLVQAGRTGMFTFLLQFARVAMGIVFAAGLVGLVGLALVLLMMAGGLCLFALIVNALAGFLNPLGDPELAFWWWSGAVLVWPWLLCMNLPFKRMNNTGHVLAIVWCILGQTFVLQAWARGGISGSDMLHTSFLAAVLAAAEIWRKSAHDPISAEMRQKEGTVATVAQLRRLFAGGIYAWTAVAGISFGLNFGSGLFTRPGSGGLVDVTQNVGTSLATRVENAAAGKGEGTAQALWCSTFAEEYEKRTGQKPSASLLEERGCR